MIEGFRRHEFTRRLANGTQLGDFIVEEFIAEGGMGQVYRASQISLGRRSVALKIVIRRDRSASQRQRIETEARQIADIHHPSLAEIYAVHEFEDVLFYALRYIDGPTLAEFVGAPPRGRIEVRRQLGFMCDVAAALAALHDRGLVHRDVKPSNIMIERREDRDDGEERAVLVDYGLVRPIGHLLSTRSGLGTELYASPEQWSVDELKPESDVFSFGATFHDILSGRRPTERPPAKHGMPFLRSVAPYVHPDLAAIIDKCLESKPQRRYADASTLLEDLRRHRDGHPVRARPLRWVSLARRFVARHPGRVAAPALLIVAIMLSVVGAARILEIRRDLHEMQSAHEQGDISVFARGVDRVGTAVLEFALADGIVSADARELQKESGQGVIARIVDALRNDDPGSAMQIALCSLSRDSVSESPLVARYVVREVDSLLNSNREIKAHSFDTATLIARFALEVESERCTQIDLSRGLRAVAMRGLDAKADATVSVRLRLLTIAGGYAESQDLPRIIELLRRSAICSEERRLALCTIERVIRRKNASGRASELPIEMLIREAEACFAALPPAVEIWKCNAFHPIWQELRSLRGLTITLAFAAARRAMPWEPRSRVDCAFATDPSRPDVAVMRDAWTLDALAADARFFDEVGRHIGSTSEVWDVIAAEVGLSRSAALEAAALSWLRTHHPISSEERESYWRNGKRRGLKRLEGRDASDEPDADTRFDFTTTSFSEVSLDHEVASRDDIAGSPMHVDFTGPRIATSRSCRAIFARSTSHWMDSPSSRCQRFYRFGESSLEIEFEVDVAATRDAMRLRLWHLAASRSHLPWEGEVLLRVAIDGHVLADQLLVDFARDHHSEIEIPPTRLGVGLHRLSIGLGAMTTTTYRLYSVELR